METTNILYSVETIRYNEGGYNSTGFSTDLLCDSLEKAQKCIEDLMHNAICESPYVELYNKDPYNTRNKIGYESFMRDLNFVIGKWELNSDGMFEEVAMKYYIKNGKHVDEEFSSDLSKFIWD